MKRIEGSGHVGNKFTDGDPATATPATIVTAAWLNDKQEELCNVVESAGITLDGNDQTQLAKAISQLAAVGSSIPLKFWQTDPDQYTVLEQSIDDPDGKGEDLLYKYVFPAGVFSAMFTQVLLPFSGYNLQMNIPYRMSTSYSGNVAWYLYYRTVSANESYSEIANWAAWAAADDATSIYSDTPSASANQRNLISGQNLISPSSAYSLNDTLQLALCRTAGSTHTGNAEVDDSILIIPVLP